MPQPPLTPEQKKMWNRRWNLGCLGIIGVFLFWVLLFPLGTVLRGSRALDMLGNIVAILIIPILVYVAFKLRKR
jgi:uncharacterized membrane protein